MIQWVEVPGGIAADMGDGFTLYVWPWTAQGWGWHCAGPTIHDYHVSGGAPDEDAAKRNAEFAYEHRPQPDRGIR